MLCDYGCGLEAKYQLKSGKMCCSKHFNSCPAVKQKNSEKNKNRIKKLIESGSFISNLGKYSENGHPSWNKGKTKNTDKRIEKISNSLKEGYKSGKIIPFMKGKQLSDETKRKLSKCGGYKTGCGKGKKGWYKGYWCDSSWELAYVIYNLDHEIKFERNKIGFEYEYENKIFKYYPDFILKDGTYVEIKGYKSKKDEAKFKYFPTNLKLKIFEFKQLEKILNYVIGKYGNNFIKMYENYKHVEIKIPCPKCGNLMLKTSKLCSNCNIHKDKVKDKPDKDLLFNLLLKNSLVDLAKQYNVSHTTISRWYKKYNIDYKKLRSK